ncbi:RelE/StbE family addiction module toxin [Draconibacterium orientale]|nr:RelE/StbE family addiction module toxin [Draconibacterium orientale]
MYSIQYTNRFKKDVKLCQKRGYNLTLLSEAIDILQATGKLPAKYRSHLLKGNYEGLYECHLKPDWLLVWEQNDHQLTLLFMTTGTHSDLF